MKVELTLDENHKLKIYTVDIGKRLCLATEEGKITLPLKSTKIKTLISILHRITKNLEEVE